MPCFFPRVAYYSADVNPITGKRPLVFDERLAWSPVPVRIHCGECVGCLGKRAQEWSLRIMHERRMASESAFVTLTYSPVNLPVGASLVKSDLQKFMKRFRLIRPPGLRFFACGEYGETTGRPHYHLLLLNSSFPDLRFYKDTAAGYPLYTSAQLNELWQFGDSWIGEVTPKSAAYVARYVTKKRSVVRLDGREPEFQVMSRRPGLGLSWFQSFGFESYRHDDCVSDGRKFPLPRYYDTKMQDVDPVRLEVLKLERRRRMLTPQARADNTHKRRIAREQLQLQQLKRFKRDL